MLAYRYRDIHIHTYIIQSVLNKRGSDISLYHQLITNKRLTAWIYDELFDKLVLWQVKRSVMSKSIGMEKSDFIILTIKQINGRDVKAPQLYRATYM